MTRIEAYGSGRVTEIPSSWAEMSPEQIRYAFRIYPRCTSPLEFNVRMLHKFLGLRARRLRGNAAENVYLLCEQCLGFLFAEADGVLRLSLNAGPTSGRRARYDRRKAARMKPWQKNLVLAWFCTCLQYLQREKLLLNGEEVDLAQLFAPEGSGSKGPAVTWNDLLVQLAKDQTIGNIDRVDEEPLFSVLQILWSNHKEAKRYEATYKTKKAH